MDLSGEQVTHFLGTTLKIAGDMVSPVQIQLPASGQELAGDHADQIQFYLVTPATVTFLRGGVPLLVNGVDTPSFAIAKQGATVALHKISQDLGWILAFT